MERAFGNLKDVIHLRPVYHRQERWVRGHIFVVALAFLVQHALERKWKRAGVSLSAMEALQALRTVQIVGSKAGDVPRCGCTSGRSPARKVLDALGVAQLSQPQAGETI